MTTPGARVRQARLRQHLTLAQLAKLAKVSIKTIQRIEADERDQYLFLVEEALGLPPSSAMADGETPAVDEAEMLRRVPHRRFWLEAARRAQEIADEGLHRPGTGELRDVPPPDTVETDKPDGQTGDSGR